jgi:hypothetical protein
MGVGSAHALTTQTKDIHVGTDLQQKGWRPTRLR